MSPMPDDNPLAGVDLAAWDAPPPPPGIADAVVHRLARRLPDGKGDGEGEGGSASEPNRIPALSPPARPHRKVWVVAACAVAAAAAAMIVVLLLDSQTEEREPIAHPEASELQRMLDRLEREHAKLQAQLDAVNEATVGATPTTIPPVPSTRPPQPTPAELDREAIRSTMNRIKDRLAACNDASFTGTITFTIRLGAGGTVERVDLDRKVAFARCLRRVLQAATFAVRSDKVFRYEVAFIAKHPKPRAACDADALHAAGNEAYANGTYEAALGHFERSLACKWDHLVATKAMLAACSAKNLAKARALWPLLRPSSQSVVQRCIANGIDPR